MRCVLTTFIAVLNERSVVHRRLDLTAPTRHMGPRKLVKQGTVLKAKSGRKLRAYLCSDILVLTDESGRSLYRMVSIASNGYPHLES